MSGGKIDIPVKLPALLLHCTGGRGEVTVAAATLDELLAELVVAWPALQTHLFDEKGRRREHVLFFLNEENVDWLPSPPQPLNKGDRLTILQAVSGG